MAVKMRLQRHGRTKAPFYHIVVADARSPRDGKFIEKLGTYNPMTVPATIDIDRDLAYSWLDKGAQPTDTVRAILRFKGVMFKKHLMRGVKKGALTLEQADEKYNAFVDVKEGKVTARAEQTKASKKAFYELVSGKPKEKKKVEAPIIEAPADEAPAEDSAE
jgi:small subunit ribosomal protein S16